MIALFNNMKYVALFIGCNILPMVCNGQQRHKDDAISIAREFCSDRLTSINNSGLTVKGSSEIKGSKLYEQEKEAYYVFHGKDKGFIIVSGDERMPSVLAYSDETYFDFENVPPAVTYWLDCYEETFLNLEDGKPVSNTKPTSEIHPEGISPLLDKIQWGQGNPFNLLCPSIAGEKTVTGCVATAMAQVMKYYEYPQRGNGTNDYYTETNHLHIVRNLSKDEFDWTNMLQKYDRSFTNENAMAVATLMANCGASVKMDYGTNSQGGSGAYQTDLLSAYVKNFDYDPDAAVLTRNYCSTADWHNLLIKELNEGRPVNYAGHSTRDGGHSFVIDGYRKREKVDYPDYHVNWGWNGSCDGYYQIVDLQPEDNGQSATRDGFNSNQQMTIGIKPNDLIDDKFICLCTDKLKSTNSNCKPGEKIKVTTLSLHNFGYHTFSGFVYVNLINEEGERLELGKTRLITLKALEEQKNLSIDLTLPSDLEEGMYTIQLSILNEQGNRFKVYSKSYPEVAVSTNGDTSISPSYISSTLGCSEAQFLTNKSDITEIKVNVYEFINLEEAPFIGDVRLLVSDSKGMSYTALGDSVIVDEIGQFEVLPDPILLTCRISGEWPDGHYRIYVGARSIGTTDYTPVLFYDYTEPAPIPKEMFFDAIIENGKIHINNLVYEIITDNINQVFNARVNRNSYGVDGKTDLNKSFPHVIIHNGRKILIKYK